MEMKKQKMNTALDRPNAEWKPDLSGNSQVDEKPLYERALKKGEAFNKSIIDSSRDWINVLDLTGRSQYMNKGGQDQIGIKDVEPFINMRYEDFWKKDDQQAAVEAITKAQQGETGSFQGFCPTLKGVQKWWDVTITPILGDHSEITGLLAVSRDITDYKDALEEIKRVNSDLERRVTERTVELSQTIEQLKEEIHERQAAETALSNSKSNFESIIEQATEGFVLVDSDARIIEANQAVERITGVPQSEIYGQYVWDFQADISGHKNVPAEVTKHIRDTFVEALNNKDAPMFKHPHEVQIVTRQGEKRFIQQVSFPVIMDSTTRLGTFVRDITVQKQIEADLHQLNNELERRVAERTEQLENMNKELGAFSYSVSHDLRAPLRIISGFANLLMEDAKESLSIENKNHLDRIVANIKRMEILINAFLDLSHLGQKPLNRQRVNTSQVIHNAWEEVCLEADVHNIQITIDDPPDCIADAVLLKQVYINLLSNAIKYSRPKPDAAIQVGWQPQDNGIVYWVKDNGVGFDMLYADKLFGLFTRMHDDNQFEGIGVGLTIAKRIIHRHGGRIWAEAAVDQGATFYFTLEEVR